MVGCARGTMAEILELAGTSSFTIVSDIVGTQAESSYIPAVALPAKFAHGPQRVFPSVCASRIDPPVLSVTRWGTAAKSLWRQAAVVISICSIAQLVQTYTFMSVNDLNITLT